MYRMAALNQEFFSEFQPQELDLFNLSPTLTSMENVTYQQIRPINQLNFFNALHSNLVDKTCFKFKTLIGGGVGFYRIKLTKL